MGLEAILAHMHAIYWARVGAGASTELEADLIPRLCRDESPSCVLLGVRLRPRLPACLSSFSFSFWPALVRLLLDLGDDTVQLVLCLGFRIPFPTLRLTETTTTTTTTTSIMT